MLRVAVQKYEYSVLDYRVVDGDSVVTLIDLGFSTFYQASCRLYGVDAPEHNTPAGKIVAKVTELWIAQRASLGIIVNSIERDKFADRYVGRIRSASVFPGDVSRCLNDYLITNGLAKSYYGEKKSPWLAEELAAIEKNAEACLKWLSRYATPKLTK